MGFRTIVFIFIVISPTFRPIYSLAFFRCLSNSGTFTELRTTSFIETTGVACWLTESEQATPVDSLKDVGRSSVKVPEFDKHLKKAGGYIGRNIMEITIKMKTMVRKPLMIKINKLRLRNLDKLFTNFNERTNTLLKICIAYTLFSMFRWCVRDGWRQGQTTILTKLLLLTLATLLLHLGGGCSTGGR